jgi:hypothetical protein
VLRALVAAGLLWLAFAGIASADRAWLPPQPLVPAGAIGGVQEVAVARDGTIILAWVQQDRGWDDVDYGSRTMVAVIGPGETGVEPVELERQNGSSVTLAANSRGDAVVVWHDHYARRLEASRLVAGTGAFGPPEPLQGPDQVTGQTAEVAINERGDIAVADRDWRAHEMGGTYFGWIAPAGAPFGPARLLGERLEPGMTWEGDVAIDPDGRATVLFADNPYYNPEFGPQGPARIGAITWSALPAEEHLEWIHTIPQGDSLGCGQIEADATGRVAAQWLHGPDMCYGRDTRVDGPMQIAWRGAGEDEFGAPLDGAHHMTQTLDGLSMSGGGEALALYRPPAPQSLLDARVALAAPFEPLTQRQALSGDPIDAMLSGDGHGLLLLGRRTTTDTYVADLGVSRREPGGAFGAVERLRNDCRPGSIWADGAVGDGGRAVVVTRDEATEGLDLHLDAELPPNTAVACDGSQTVVEPPDEPAGLPAGPPAPPLPRPGAVVAAGDGVAFGNPRITSAGRLRTVTVAVRCVAACDVDGVGRLVKRARVLARARGAARAKAQKTARLRMRFRLSRRAARAVRAKRRGTRYTLDLAVRRPGAPPSTYRVVARGR